MTNSYTKIPLASNAFFCLSYKTVKHDILVSEKSSREDFTFWRREHLHKVNIPTIDPTDLDTQFISIGGILKLCVVLDFIIHFVEYFIVFIALMCLARPKCCVCASFS